MILFPVRLKNMEISGWGSSYDIADSHVPCWRSAEYKYRTGLTKTRIILQHTNIKADEKKYSGKIIRVIPFSIVKVHKKIYQDRKSHFKIDHLKDILLLKSTKFKYAKIKLLFNALYNLKVQFQDMIGKFFTWLRFAFISSHEPCTFW